MNSPKDQPHFSIRPLLMVSLCVFVLIWVSLLPTRSQRRESAASIRPLISTDMNNTFGGGTCDKCEDGTSNLHVVALQNMENCNQETGDPPTCARVYPNCLWGCCKDGADDGRELVQGSTCAEYEGDSVFK